MIENGEIDISKFKSFSCQEKGCPGIITSDPDFIVPFESVNSPISRCPFCGRLYWLQDGEPFRDEKLKKAFFIGNKDKFNIEFVPLNSQEKRKIVDRLIFDSKKDEKEEWVDYHRVKFGEIERTGHSSDCPVEKSNRCICICGYITAKRWLSAHPPRER